MFPMFSDEEWQERYEKQVERTFKSISALAEQNGWAANHDFRKHCAESIAFHTTNAQKWQAMFTDTLRRERKPHDPEQSS